MEQEILTSIRAVGYGQYNMVVYSTKIDEYGELIPYRQMVLAKRKSSEVLVERNVIRQAHTNLNYEHQRHNLSHLIRDYQTCLLYTSPSPRDGLLSRMPSSA